MPIQTISHDFYTQPLQQKSTVSVYYEGIKTDSYSITGTPEFALDKVYQDRCQRAKFGALWSGCWQITTGQGKKKLVKDLLVD